MNFFGLTKNKNIIKDTNFLRMDVKLGPQLLNVLGALDNPKGITNHSNNPCEFLKAIFHSSPGLNANLMVSTA